MPGSYTFRPIEANLTHNTDLVGKMNPYCAFVIGNEIIKSKVCKKGGKHPHWNDTITIPINNEPTMMVELLDKDTFTRDDSIGNFMIDLNEVQAQGQVSRWYALTYKNKPAGEILMESVFQPDMAQAMIIEQETIATQPTIMQEEIVNQIPTHHEGKIFVEQRQVVEPHTFTKAVDVVETRPVVKEIEVMEPVKVIKDVQFTEAVPVKKEIEVVEPQVVKKEVEVIEPRLVTKEIQVVENVPVMKEVEIVEPRTIIKEVETWEPQTFTKQVEVTEQVPVKKQVETTEAVTVTKAVDFVEPVITTKTVTKELQQPVVVDQKITTHVGPATLIGVETEVREHAFVDRQSEIRMTEEERLLGKNMEGHASTSTFKKEHKKF